MKKFTVNAIAVALASVCGSAAFAGSITSPAADTNATKYAVESLVNTTDLTGPAVVYTMGVARTTAQDFTIIMTPSAGATFTAAYCAASMPVAAGGGGAATVTVKRASTTECAYEVDVTTAFTTATTLTFAAPVFDAHTLATAGNSISVSLNLWDLGETARIDNSAAVTRKIAESGNALTLTAAQDTGTVANVNNANGPLFGFVVANDDTATIAKATFVVNNNSAAATYVLPDGATNWDFNLHGTSLNVTVAGTNFSGLKATTPVVVVPPAGAAPAVTLTSSSAAFSLLPANIVGGIGNYNVSVTMEAAGNTSLGTSRTFGVSAVGDVATGADVSLAGNTSWWVWSANAIQLSSSYMSTDNGTGVLTRFFFQNLGTTGATYSATCQAETGKTVTAGTAATGTLNAGQTVIDAKNVCSFSTGIRGSVTFTINAPAANIKGAYNLGLNGTTSSFIPMERPYAGSTY